LKRDNTSLVSPSAVVNLPGLLSCDRSFMNSSSIGSRAERDSALARRARFGAFQMLTVHRRHDDERVFGQQVNNGILSER
jgi:hypothetical protein